MGRLVLIRHGETEWSADGRHTGRTDVPLTAAGRQRAQALGVRLRGWRFARVLTSPLQRARQTCELAGLGERAEVCADLAEWDYGAYEGRSTAQIRGQRPGWFLWRDGVPEGETLADVGRRADRVLAGLTGLAGDVALFAHGHILRVLAARWLELPPDGGRLFVLGTAALGVLGHEHDQPALLRWNDGPDP